MSLKCFPGEGPTSPTGLYTVSNKLTESPTSTPSSFGAISDREVRPDGLAEQKDGLVVNGTRLDRPQCLLTWEDIVVIDAPRSSRDNDSDPYCVTPVHDGVVNHLVLAAEEPCPRRQCRAPVWSVVESDALCEHRDTLRRLIWRQFSVWWKENVVSSLGTPVRSIGRR